MATKHHKSPRRRPIQGRSLATVEVLLQTTAQILMSHGYEKATTNEIARRAGVSIGSLYQYFPNKEALLEALVAQHFQERRAAFEEATADVHPETMPERVRQVIHGIIEAHKVNPQLQRALHTYTDLTQVDAFERHLEALVARSLRGNEEAVRRPNPELAATMIVRAFAGFLRISMRADPAWMFEPAVKDELTDLAMRYLLKES
jgi:AcrR family transcriptional regulator